MKFFICFIVTILLLPFNTFSQSCCTSGANTFGGLERGTLNKGKLKMGLSFISNNLNSTFNNNVKIPDPLNRNASVTVFNFEAELGLADNISLLVVGSYTIKDRTTSFRNSIDNSDEKVTFRGNGFSDVILLAKYQLIRPDISSFLSLSVGGGVKLPVGSYNKENNGTRLPIDLQPGTGSSDILFWANFYKGFLENSFSFSSNFFYKYSGVNFDGYRIGDEYLLSVNGEYYFTEYFYLSIGLRGRFAGKDFLGSRFLQSTGGYFLDILPGLIYSEEKFSIRIFYQSPLYRDVRGIQLTTSNIFGSEIFFNLDL